MKLVVQVIGISLEFKMELLESVELFVIPGYNCKRNYTIIMELLEFMELLPEFIGFNSGLGIGYKKNFMSLTS